MECVLNVMVSLYSCYTDTTSDKMVNLVTWLSDTTYKEQVEELRREKDPKKRKLLKATLECVTISGLFDKRTKDGLAEHSGLGCIDIDGKENEHIANFSELKKMISGIKNVAYCGLSVSGEGYFVIIPIAYPEKHEQQYAALVNLFESFGIVVDRQCCNVNRTRTRHYDPDAYANWRPPRFKGLVDLSRNESSPKSIEPDFELEGRVKDVIEQILEKEADITQNRYDWYRIGCSLANTFSERGLEYFLAVSQFYATREYRYSEREATRMFRSCLKAKNKTTIRTFFYYCKKYGVI